MERRWGKHTGTGSTKARQFGRIADDDWRAIKAACQRAGMSLTEWALPTLLDKARREGSRKTA